MDKHVAAVLCVLFVCACIAGAAAQTNTITPTDTFPIPQLGSQIQFAENMNYTSATIENNTWYFDGLKAGGYAGSPIRGHLHISAANCTVTITYLDAWTQPEIGTVGLQWVKYNAAGAGIQTLDGNDLFPNSDKWTQWTITVNGEKQPEGSCWNITDSKQLTISTPGGQSFVEVSVIHTAANSDTAPLPIPAPASVDFVAGDIFAIPSSNASLSFAVDGSYDNANLNGATWSFTNLTLNNYFVNAGTFAPNVTSRDVLPYIYQSGYPASLDVSAKDSNVTITGITPLTWYSYKPTLNYTVQGTGSQTFTLPFKLSRFNWTVTIDGVQKPEGYGWYKTDDYQIRVTSAAAKVTIIGEPIEVPFPPVYDWSVFRIIISIITAAILLSIAFILYRRRHTRKHPSVESAHS
jgi:hypothetical protein